MRSIVYASLVVLLVVPLVLSASSPYPGWDVNFWSKFSNGYPTSNDFFPIAVWLQSPFNAQKFKNIGINTYIGLYNNPTSSDISSLDSAGMYVINEANAALKGYSRWVGPAQQDEPDNAQPGDNGYLPCIDPSVIKSKYNSWKSADPTRPVFISYGMGVAETNWVGRGTCTGRTDMYAEYSKGADFLSYDVYPVNNNLPLFDVAQGVDNLYSWTNRSKPVMLWIEASNYDGNAPSGRPNIDDITAETWMALTHNARGIGYFCHQFSPSFIENACESLPSFRSALVSVNGKINSLARALNAPTILQSSSAAVKIASQTSGLDIQVLTKQNATGYYVLVVNRYPKSGSATFSLPTGASGASTVQVLFESRSLSISNGQFTDSFGSYSPKTYFISAVQGTAAPTQAAPTPKPTAAPTPKPTPKPTGSATPRPTPKPTARPTGSATPRPTASPTAAPTTGPKSAQSFYTGTTTPSLDGDMGSVTLGLKFSSVVAGSVTGLKIYRGSGVSISKGALYSSSGALLGSLTFSATGTGWIQANFASPIAITANTQYVAAYFAPNGRYAAINNGFGSTRSVGDLRAPTSAGVYFYGSNIGFPTSSYMASEYFVSPIFVAN